MKIKSIYTKTNQIRIHYERTGGDKPPLIMCHGVTDNGRCMLRLAEHLAPDYDVILVDARGHGKSDAPDTGYSADDHAEDLKGLCESLSLMQPIIYGHSMGARTVSRFAAKYPEIPQAVILEDPVQIIPPTESELQQRDMWLNQMVEEVQQWKNMTLDEHLGIAQQQAFKDWTEPEQVEWAKSKLQVSPKVFEIGFSMGQISDDFPKIQCPVLILKADAAEETKSKEREAAKLIPNVIIFHVSGASHNIRRDDFKATTHYIDEFLRSLQTNQ